MYIRPKPKEYECIMYTEETDISKLMRWSNEKVHTTPIEHGKRKLVVDTPLGTYDVNIGDYIVKYDEISFFVIDPQTFHKKYDVVSRKEHNNEIEK